MKRKEDILDRQHWKFANYKQRMRGKDWRQILLNDDDKIIFEGRMVPLVAKDLGCGVYEVSKRMISPTN